MTFMHSLTAALRVVMEYLRPRAARLRTVAPERLLLLAALLFVAVLWWWAYAVQPRPLRVVVFAVGKGDAILIQAPGDRAVLIDGGSSNLPRVGEQVLAPNLSLQGIHQLDAVIATHPDSDHVNGLSAVFDAMPVRRFLCPWRSADNACYQQLCAQAAARGIPRHTLRAGDRINLGPEVRLRVLAPENVPPSDDADTNNASLVCLLEYRHARMLLTGDLETAGEEALLQRHVDLHADILKVAHHGSRNGSGDAFLAAVRPTWAVISAPGTAEHPHRETLARLQRHGIHVLRTDVQGQLILTTDGDGWRIHPYRQ